LLLLVCSMQVNTPQQPRLVHLTSERCWEYKVCGQRMRNKHGKHLHTPRMSSWRAAETRGRAFATYRLIQQHQASITAVKHTEKQHSDSCFGWGHNVPGPGLQRILRSEHTPVGRRAEDAAVTSMYPHERQRLLRARTTSQKQVGKSDLITVVPLVTLHPSARACAHRRGAFGATIRLVSSHGVAGPPCRRDLRHTSAPCSSQLITTSSLPVLFAIESSKRLS
jgi:hypothetical protein